MIQVHGAGIAGLLIAHRLRSMGHEVCVHADHGGCSPHAGGMLAPWSELDHAEPHILSGGHDAVARWNQILPTPATGTLHLAHRPEWPLLDQLADRIRRSGHPCEPLNSQAIHDLEPALARFQRGLFVPGEGAVDPAVVLPLLGTADQPAIPVLHGIDARGLIGDPTLRGVRGEFLRVATPVAFRRPIRLHHPRYPLYIIPRRDSLYVGATMLERDDDGPPEVRSLLELLSALYSLHPDLGDAAVLESGAAVRPAYTDNAPKITRQDGTVRVNGLFRHGYLLGPSLAEQAVALYLQGDDDPDQRRSP